MWITFAGFRIYLAMEREKYSARPEINLCSIPFPRCTTSGLRECFPDDHLATHLPFLEDGYGRAQCRHSW